MHLQVHSQIRFLSQFKTAANISPRRVSPWQAESEFCFKAISIELAADMQCEAFHYHQPSTTGMKVFTGTTKGFNRTTTGFTNTTMDFTRTKGFTRTTAGAIYEQHSVPTSTISRVNSTTEDQKTAEVTLATETQRPLFQNMTTTQIVANTTINEPTISLQDTVATSTFATSEPYSTSTKTSLEFSSASEEVVAPSASQVDVAAGAAGVAGVAADAALNVASGTLNAAADAAGIAADVAGVAADAAVNAAGAAADAAVNAAGAAADAAVNTAGTAADAAVNAAGAAADAAVGAALGAMSGVFGL